MGLANSRGRSRALPGGRLTPEEGNKGMRANPRRLQKRRQQAFARKEGARGGTRGSPTLLLVVERRVDLGHFFGLDRVTRLAVAGSFAAVRRLAAEVDPEILEREPLAVAGADLLERAQ